MVLTRHLAEDVVGRKHAFLLAHYVTPGHAEGTEGYTEQHDCGATVRNSYTRAKKRPFSKETPISEAGNRDNSMQITDVPDFRAEASVIRKQIRIQTTTT